MKKLLCIICIICEVLSLAACGAKAPEGTAAGFKPALDTDTRCSITVAGSYDNFEALEAEFDRFNAYYPNVQLTMSFGGTFGDGNVSDMLSFADKALYASKKKRNCVTLVPFE